MGAVGESYGRVGAFGSGLAYFTFLYGGGVGVGAEASSWCALACFLLVPEHLALVALGVAVVGACFFVVAAAIETVEGVEAKGLNFAGE